MGLALKQGLILESPVLQSVRCWWTLQSLWRPVCLLVGMALGGMWVWLKLTTRLELDLPKPAGEWEGKRCNACSGCGEDAVCN